MEIINVKEYNPNLGYSIFIKEFSKKDFRNVERLLFNLGFVRDYPQEKYLRESLKVGLKKLELKRGGIFSKLRFKYENLLMTLKGPRQIERIFKLKKNVFHFGYIQRLKMLSGVWKHKDLTGEEFASLIYSNQKV